MKYGPRGLGGLPSSGERGSTRVLHVHGHGPGSYVPMSHELLPMVNHVHVRAAPAGESQVLESERNSLLMQALRCHMAHDTPKNIINTHHPSMLPAPNLSTTLFGMDNTALARRRAPPALILLAQAPRQQRRRQTQSSITRSR